MEITLYRYRTRNSRWNGQDFTFEELQDLAASMNLLPFQGDEEDRQFGFAHCAARENIIYGLFVQKFPKKITDYDSQTKEELNQILTDTGEYLFLFFPDRYELYLQTKRSADLPSQDQMVKRFIGAFQLAVANRKFFFTAIDVTEDEIDRERILELFYKESDAVTELELEDFDRQLVYEEKSKRNGQIQTYFNPIDKYQPAMEEAALRLGNNAQKISMKAKQGQSFKKDPIARAALEASRKPVKITYSKDSEVHVEYGLTKKKEVLTIEASDFDLDDQIEGILRQIAGRDTLRRRPGNDNQIRLV